MIGSDAYCGCAVPSVRRLFNAGRLSRSRFEYIEPYTMRLSALREDVLPMRINYVTVLDEVEFARRRTIDVQEVAAFKRGYRAERSER